LGFASIGNGSDVRFSSIAAGLAPWVSFGGAMANKSKTKCLSCGEIFTVDVRNRGRQKYCSKPACRAAAKAARQRRWREQPQNQDYFRGPVHVERVRVWRVAHPGYWRAHRRLEPVALQDALVAKTQAKSMDCLVLSRVEQVPALQDALGLQDPVLIGLISQLTDSTLQDSIAETVRRLLELGQDILSGTTLDARKTTPAP
jgi:hypothetical protein